MLRATLVKQLSGYAAALKHIALRGRVALGLTAKAQELALYLQGSLPPDYRPPPVTKWDDTVERWAYAWQFPYEESTESASQRIAKLPVMQNLIDLAKRLIEAPPMKVAALTSSNWPPVKQDFGEEMLSAALQAPDIAELTEIERNAQMIASESAALVEELEKDDSYASADVVADESSEMAEVPSQETDEELEDLPIVSADSEEAEINAVTSHMLTQYGTAEMAKKLNIPTAYIDDGSEISAASKALGFLAVKDLGVPYDNGGIATMMAALIHLGYLECAVALFRFAVQVGFQDTAFLYTVVMHGYARRGDANTCMSLIEEMKSLGVTPQRATWVALMHAFHRAGDHSAVIQVIDNMKALANIEPDEITFLYHFKALAADRSRGSSPYEAISLFDHMENVSGILPTRPVYHAFMQCMASSPLPDFRSRCVEAAKKMEMVGILWDSETYAILIWSCAIAGDVTRVKELFGKMNSEGIAVNLKHLTGVVVAHSNAIASWNMSYDELRENEKSPLPIWLHHLSICFGLHELVLDRGWQLRTPFVDSLLGLTCRVAQLCLKHCPDDAASIQKFESQATTLWEKTYAELNLKKSARSYEVYIGLLGAQLRLDEAEKLFQQLVLQEDMVPTSRCYEEMMWMHIRSGEEGGTRRALHYLEAMERAKIRIRPATLSQFAKINNEASYRRDMKRRARRIMQAREEYLARKAEGTLKTQKPFSPPTTTDEGLPALTPLPLSSSSTLAWWEKWKLETISKHELFENERSDGMPRGEDFAEKNEALRKMGIESKFLTKELVPDQTKHRLLPAMREDGSEPAGSLWALDGGEMAYPTPGLAPDGWGTTLWRERRIIEKEIKKVREAKASSPPLSKEGNALRLAPEQLLIESASIKTPGELSDAIRYPDHFYDDGTPKPSSEIAFRPPWSGELVWKKEEQDELAMFKTEEELAPLDDENEFRRRLDDEVTQKAKELVGVIKNKEEETAVIEGRGISKKFKYDYLEKWRTMYRQGTLEPPDEPLVRFGSAPDDHKNSLAAQIRAWYAKSRREPPSEETLQLWKENEERDREVARGRHSPKAKRMKSEWQKAPRADLKDF